MFPRAEDIPKGSEVGIPKGTRLQRNYYPGEAPTETKRKQVVKVWSAHNVVVLPPPSTRGYVTMNYATSTTALIQYHESVEIVWAGKGGYWKSAIWGEGWEILSRPGEVVS